ncbi:MAG: AraC family transcriptional regulator [Leptotrichiaceae bacterium]|nr:AraC family transcriptional regulator [Leptotrichiaceae bacterium]
MTSLIRYSIKNKLIEPWIKFIWHFEAENENIHHKLLPTDCIDIIINFSDKIIYEIENEYIIAPFIHVNGLRKKCSYIYQKGDMNIWGISFQPFGFYPFINKSLRDIQDKIINLSDLSMELTEKLINAVLKGENDEHIVKNIETVLFQEIKTTKKQIQKIQKMYSFFKSNENTSVELFCQNNKINQKTFIRNVLCYTGYTPKTLHSIIRFQKAVNRIIYKKIEKFSEIAYICGFADQSHFIREFRKFSGVTPSTFIREKMTIKEKLICNYK